MGGDRKQHLLLLSGHDPQGFAGVSVDARMAQAFQVSVRSVITALTAQHASGAGSAGSVPVSLFAPQLEAAFEGAGNLFLKLGVLPNREILDTLRGFLRKYRDKTEAFVYDPVLFSSSGISLSSLKGDDLSSLAPFVSLITPNIPEAEFLCGRSITSEGELLEAGKELTGQYRAVLIKGGHLNGEKVTDYLFTKEGEIHRFEGKRLAKQCRGTGCALSTAITCYLSYGLSLPFAVHRAKEVVSCSISSGKSEMLNVEEGVRTALRSAAEEAGGSYLFNLSAEKASLSNELRAVFQLQNALMEMAKLPMAPLLPEIQANIAFLEGDATHYGDYRDVLGVPGRLVRFGESFTTVALPAFGASRHIARVLLTCKKYDKNICCVIALRYSPDILKLAEKRGLKTASFSRTEEPEDVAEKEGSSLEWGTNRAIRQKGFVPDVVYDCGGEGKEPVIRLIGRSLDQLVQEVSFLAKELKKEL